MGVAVDESSAVVEVHRDSAAGNRGAAAGDDAEVEDTVHDHRKGSWGDSSWAVLAEESKDVAGSDTLASRLVGAHILLQGRAGNNLRFVGDGNKRP